MTETLISTQTALRFECLGPARLGGPRREHLTLRTRKQLGLLFYLVRRARPVSRDELIDLFWSEDPEKLARHSLSQCCSLVNKVLGAEVIRTDGRDRLAIAEGAVSLDVTDFERHVERGAYREAIALWRGSLLEGLWVQRAPQFERWLSDERERLERLFRRLAHTRIEALRNAGEHQEMRDEADRLLQHDPLDEKAMHACLEALTLLGDRSLALRRYGEFETRLRRELDAEPGAALRSWARRVRKSDGGAPASLPPASRISEITVLPAVQPFFGRTEEFSMLWKAWETAGTGKGAFIIVEGEAGIGKTALATKLVNQAHVAGGSVAFVKCYRTEKSVPFAPITALIRQLSRLPGFVALDPVWIGELTRLVPELRERYPNVPQPMAVDDAARHRLSDASASAARAVADEQPLMIVVDDLQDADEASLALLHYLARQLATQSVLVLGARRLGGGLVTEFEKAFFDSQLVIGNSVELKGLAKADVGRLVHQVAARRDLQLPSEEVDQIVATTRGNPLLAIEAAVSRNAAATVSSSCPGAGLADFEASATDRLAKMSAEGLAVASTIAIAGRPMTEYELVSVTKLPVADLALALEELDGAHLVQRIGPKLALTHERYGQPLESTVSTEGRASVHRSLALLLRRTADRNPAARFEVARHFAAASMQQDARTQALRAAQYALSLGAVRERAAALELAMSMSRDFDSGIAVDLAECYLTLRGFSQLHAICEAAEHARRPREELSPDFGYLRIAAEYHAGSAPLPSLANELARLLERHSRFKLEAAARTLSMRLAYKTASPRVVRAASRSLRRILRVRGASTRAHTLQATAYIAAKFYLPSRSLPLLRQALECAIAGHDLDLEYLIRSGIGAVCRQLGNFTESIRELEIALALAQRTLNQQLKAAALVDIAAAEISRDKLDRSEELFLTADAILQAHPDRVVHGLLLTNRAELMLLQDRFVESRNLFGKVLDQAVEVGDIPRTLQILGGLALCAQRVGNGHDLRRYCARIEYLDGADPLLSHERWLLESALSWNTAINEGDPARALSSIDASAKSLRRRDVDHWLLIELEGQRLRKWLGIGRKEDLEELAAVSTTYGAALVARLSMDLV